MNKTGIEYGQRAWNFLSGCRNWQNGVCGGGGKDFYCWAKGQTELRSKHYPFGFEPTFYLSRLYSPLTVKKPSRILAAFMGDFAGDWMFQGNQVRRDYDGELISGKEVIAQALEIVRRCPQHTFLFLTKCPWNLLQFQFPENAWVGVSATNQKQYNAGIVGLSVVKAKVKFISFEPLLEAIHPKNAYDLSEVNWVIIGAATGKGAKFPISLHYWEVIEAADKAGISIFIKENLLKIYPQLPTRQEFPR